MRKNLKFETSQEIFDPTTGEVNTVTRSKSFSIKTSSEAFFMVFIQNMSGLFKLTSSVDIKVLHRLCSVAEFNTGKVSLTKSKRKDFVTSLGMSPQSLYNSISRLKKSGLIAGERGDYEIDPSVFWRGTTDARDKLLKEKGLEIRIKFQAHDDDESAP